MKALLYSIFVISALLISGFARAENLLTPYMQQASYATTINIDDVFQPNKNDMTLQISTYLPTPCYFPSVTLTEDTKNANTLTIRLTSPLQTGSCIQKRVAFETVVDLSVLAQASGVQLDPNTSYTVKAQGSDFQMQVYGAQLLAQ